MFYKVLVYNTKIKQIEYCFFLLTNLSAEMFLLEFLLTHFEYKNILLAALLITKLVLGIESFIPIDFPFWPSFKNNYIRKGW